MSDDEQTHFQFEFRGVSVEISGDRDFVDSMYQLLMRDMEAARRGALEDLEPMEFPDEERIIWVHRTTDMMHKIYMATPAELQNSPLGRVVDSMAIGKLYAHKSAFEPLLADFAGSNTLWAEFTDAGRKRIEPAGEDEDPTIEE